MANAFTRFAKTRKTTPAALSTCGSCRSARRGGMRTDPTNHDFMAVSYSDDEQTYFILMMRAGGTLERRSMIRGRWRPVRRSPQPFGLASRGYTCALRGQQIHLGALMRRCLNFLERALRFKRFLAWFGTRVT